MCAPILLPGVELSKAPNSALTLANDSAAAGPDDGVLSGIDQRADLAGPPGGLPGT
jgi:hypothetical protein